MKEKETAPGKHFEIQQAQLSKPEKLLTWNRPLISWLYLLIIITTSKY